ncbi:hypothetical protein MYSTI_02110 [Myxococcus stipitatus DSM 14675]|uniref:Uncharacterized protein n=1 Tax=Myxococcus stipitatus (strain DSM 14675 / JCM 12634 / Mx s8) TaxID=1278073 RepID=L7UAI6_MYXSD|nr:hypothetical protein MYSTI_02110 [Myxococcus stipitatus DSM 14675]
MKPAPSFTRPTGHPGSSSFTPAKPPADLPRPAATKFPKNTSNTRGQGNSPQRSTLGDAIKTVLKKAKEVAQAADNKPPVRDPGAIIKDLLGKLK